MLTSDLSVDEFALASAGRVYREYVDTLGKLQPSAPKVWRYEDVIYEKVAWARAMPQFLGIEPPPKHVLQEIVRQFYVLPGDEDPGGMFDRWRRVTTRRSSPVPRSSSCQRALLRSSSGLATPDPAPPGSLTCCGARSRAAQRVASCSSQSQEPA